MDTDGEDPTVAATLAVLISTNVTKMFISATLKHPTVSMTAAHTDVNVFITRND